MNSGTNSGTYIFMSSKWRHLDDIKKNVPVFIPEFGPEYKSEFRSNSETNSGTNSGMNSGTYFFHVV